MEEACQSWLRPLFQDDQWHLSGEKQNFRIQFKALSRTAHLQANKAHGILKPKTRGEPWTEIAAKTPSGSTKIFVNKDRPPNIQRLNFLQRKFLELLVEHYPTLKGLVSAVGATFHPELEAESLILVDKQPFVAIRAPTRDGEPQIVPSPDFDFNARGIDTTLLESALSAAARPARRVDTSQWCK
eukprot:9321278-Karenia_brevis.AAC.1